jgi:glycosyltransferase involved in cell wall biosynthesis
MTKGERVIAVSESIRKYILKNFRKTSDDKITVIYRGVSSEQFPRDFTPDLEWLQKWRMDFPQLEGKTVLLLPGRVSRWKGQDDLIQVISALQMKGMDFYGLIAGEVHEKKKEYEQHLKNLAEEMGVSDKVIFLGHRKDIKEVMAVSDIIYSLSREPEAFGRVTLEAMSLGKPVVAYSHGGIEEQLLALYPQGLVAVGDVDSVIDRTLNILNDASQLGSIEDFSLDKMLSSTLGVYNQILNLSRH